MENSSTIPIESVLSHVMHQRNFALDELAKAGARIDQLETEMSSFKSDLEKKMSSSGEKANGPVKRTMPGEVEAEV